MRLFWKAASAINVFPNIYFENNLQQALLRVGTCSVRYLLHHFILLCKMYGNTWWKKMLMCAHSIIQIEIAPPTFFHFLWKCVSWKLIKCASVNIFLWPHLLQLHSRTFWKWQTLELVNRDELFSHICLIQIAATMAIQPYGDNDSDEEMSPILWRFLKDKESKCVAKSVAERKTNYC